MPGSVSVVFVCNWVNMLRGQSYSYTDGAGAAAVVAGLLVALELDFCTACCSFLYGERAAVGAVEENGCEHDGLLFDKERMAEAGLIGIFVAMMGG